MAELDIATVVQQLASTTVNDTEDLNFSGKGLKLDSEDDAKEIVVAINTCERLSALRLEGNTLGVNAAKAIAKALESHPEFKRALWKDMFTGRLKSEIPDALNFLSGGLILAGAQLSELDLSDNALGPIGVKGIQVLLENRTCFQLQQLRLNNNGLGIGGGEMLAQALLKCHKNSISSERPFALKTFICGRNRLENEGAKALAEFFKTVGSLEEISMPQNGIYSDGISALAAAFSQNPRLQTINLNDNTVTDIGGEFLAQAIVSLESLRVLNLGDCLLRCGGAKSLATALKEGHPELEELYLGFNEIRAETGLIILDCLKNKKKLLKVDLDGNCFGVDGAKKIEESFENYLPEVLGSLSEDEGADDDTGDNDDLNDDVSEYDEDEDRDEHIEIPKHQTLQSERTLIPRENDIPSTQVTAKEFLANPSAEKLLALGNNRVSQIMDEVSNDTDYDKRIALVLKIASCVSIDNENVKNAACECADSLLKDIFDSAEKDGNLAIISNSLLVHLGLIKSEDKSFSPITNLMGPLIVLEHVVKQPYFSRITKEILQLFLSRPNKAVESCGNAKHKLMQSLYRF